MEAHGTNDVGVRVSHLENTVEALHRDSVRTQAALAGLSSKVDSITNAISDLSIKLDQHRTRRPDLAGVAAVVSLILVIGGLAMAPLYQRMDRLQYRVDEMSAIQWERGGIIAKYDVDREHWSRELERLRDDVDRMERGHD